METRVHRKGRQKASPMINEKGGKTAGGRHCPPGSLVVGFRGAALWAATCKTSDSRVRLTTRGRSESRQPRCSRAQRLGTTY